MQSSMKVVNILWHPSFEKYKIDVPLEANTP
jgi:hypothetical protein